MSVHRLSKQVAELTDYEQGVHDERRRVQLILMNEDARNGHWVRYVSELLIEAKPATDANAVIETA